MLHDRCSTPSVTFVPLYYSLISVYIYTQVTDLYTSCKSLYLLLYPLCLSFEICYVLNYNCNLYDNRVVFFVLFFLNDFTFQYFNLKTFKLFFRWRWGTLNIGFKIEQVVWNWTELGKKKCHWSIKYLLTRWFFSLNVLIQQHLSKSRRLEKNLKKKKTEIDLCLRTLLNIFTHFCYTRDLFEIKQN